MLHSLSNIQPLFAPHLITPQLAGVHANAVFSLSASHPSDVTFTCISLSLSLERGYHYLDIGPFTQVEAPCKKSNPNSSPVRVRRRFQHHEFLTLVFEEPIRVCIHHEVSNVELV